MVTALLTILLVTTPISQPVDVGVYRIKLPDARDASGKPIDVFVEFAAFSVDSEDPHEVTNVVVTRPESPAAKFSIMPRFDYSPPNDLDITNVFLAMRANGGNDNSGREIMKGLDSVRDYLDREAKHKEDIDPNAFIKPGGWTTRHYGRRKQQQFMTCTIFTEFKQGSLNMRNAIETINIPIGTYWEPGFTPFYENFVPDAAPDKKFYEETGGMFVQPADGSMMAVGVMLPTFDKPMEYISTGAYANEVVKDNGGASLLTNLSNIGYKITDFPAKIGEMAPYGNDMNYLEFPQVKNPCMSDFYAPPGTCWLPSNPAYQVMTTGVKTHIDYHNFNVYAALDSELQGAPNQMRVLCLNMDKKEPAAGIKYLPIRTTDPIITQLANKMNNTNYRGPWDQARMWIYTDRATMDDINKRISPKLSPAAYMLGLADVGLAGGLDSKMLTDEKLIRPDLILGSGAPPYCIEFLLNNFDANMKDKLGAYLNKSGQDLLKLASGDKYATDHLTLVLHRVLNFKSGKDRMALLQALEKGETNLGALKGKFGSARASLYSSDQKEVLLALALTESGIVAKSDDSLAYLATSGASAEIKSKAQKLLGN